MVLDQGLRVPSRDGGGGGGRGVGDVVLAGDDGAVAQAGGDVVGKVCVEGEQNGDGVGEGADGAEEVDGGLEAAGEEAGAGEEEVADAGAGEAEAARGPHALDGVEVEAVEVGADEFALGRRDVGPQRVAGFEDVEPLGAGLVGAAGQAVVEEALDGRRPGVAVVRDEADEAGADVANAS